jgi:hypothetical protein
VKAVRSFHKGGFYNPAFYANSTSTILSATRFILNTAAFCCPGAITIPLYGLAVCSGTAANTIDNTLGLLSIPF